MAKVGRPSSQTPEKLAQIVERLSEGEPLAQICRDKKMPQLRTVYDWMDADHEFSAAISRARISGHDMIAQDAMRIVDEHPPTVLNGGTDSGYVSWQKNRVWTRLQLLAKWDPKRYGERVTQELSGPGGGDIPVSVAVRFVRPD